MNKKVEIRKYESYMVEDVIAIWNDIVEDGIAFPQLELLTPASGEAYFREQTYTGVAIDKETQEVVGMYILHPNNIGRCGHICNASYAVKKNLRGQGVGEELVLDCLEQGKSYGFQIMQFNAVVRTNYGALHLYKKLGFTQLGTIPGGFLLQDGRYEDIILHYKEL